MDNHSFFPFSLALIAALAALILFPGTSTAQTLDTAPNLYEQLHAQIEKERTGNKDVILRDFVSKAEAISAYRELSRSLYDCAVTIDRVLRLRCYDRISVDLGINTADWKEKEDRRLGTYGFWEASELTNDIGEQVLYMRLKPDNTITGRQHSALKPELILKCTPNDLEVYLDWKRALVDDKSKKFYIEYRIDQREDFVTEWNLSLDKKAAFTPDPVEFIEQVQEAEKISFVFTTEDDGVQRLLFSLVGLDQAMGLVIEKCYE